MLAVTVLVGVPARAVRHEAVLQDSYQGTRPADYTHIRDRVERLVKQAQLDVSVALGLIQYKEGFQYPLHIRFEDAPPAGQGLENTLAYVQLGRMNEDFAQQLVIHLAELSGSAGPSWVDAERVFYHEMTHVVLNDAVGGDASLRLPLWVQEGYAQFVAKEGESRLREAGAAFRKQDIREMRFDVRRPYRPLAYPQYYLAIRYLNDKHSINAVQALIRHLIEGRPLEEAVRESAGLSFDAFLANVNRYTQDTFLELAHN